VDERVDGAVEAVAGGVVARWRRVRNSMRAEAVAEGGVQVVAGGVISRLRRVRNSTRVEKSLARVLHGGAAASGALFAASLALEVLPTSHGQEVAVDALRKAGASLLLGTPVVRLVVSGLTLGLRGEWRYAGYAAAVIALLGVAVGARLAG
jgi:hypothetical protein